MSCVGILHQKDGSPCRSGNKKSRKTEAFTTLATLHSLDVLAEQDGEINVEWEGKTLCLVDGASSLTNGAQHDES